MQFESVYPFLLIIAPFAIACFAEALFINLFKLKRFWAALGTAILVNLLSLAVLYGSAMLLGKLGYAFNGLRLPLQAVLFFWWLTIITDGVLLQLLTKHAETEKIYRCSIVMNTFSWLFLYFFISNN